MLIQTSGRGRGCAEVVPLGSAVFKYKCLLQHDFANLAVIDIQPDDGDSTALQARAKAVISGLRSAKGKFGLHDSFRWGVESGARCMASASAIAVAAALSARACGVLNAMSTWAQAWVEAGRPRGTAACCAHR